MSVFLVENAVENETSVASAEQVDQILTLTSTLVADQARIWILQRTLVMQIDISGHKVRDDDALFVCLASSFTISSFFKLSNQVH